VEATGSSVISPTSTTLHFAQSQETVVFSHGCDSINNHSCTGVHKIMAICCKHTANFTYVASQTGFHPQNHSRMESKCNGFSLGTLMSCYFTLAAVPSAWQWGYCEQSE